MANHYAIIAGSGNTSRANVEALLEDYIYAHKKHKLNFVLAFNKKPSQGQVFAAQLALEKNIDLLIICREGASLNNLPSASVSFNEEPFTLATTISEKDTAVGFIMPSLDEVEYTDKVIRAFSEAGIEMLDLTKGLTPIKPMSENSSNEDIDESYQNTDVADIAARVKERSEEHTSELQSH